MKRALLLALTATLLPTLALTACSEEAKVAPTPTRSAAVTVTHYNDLTELFVEHRLLVVGKDRRFDAHLSWLADYRAVDAGTLTVELRWPDGTVDKGQKGISDTPGIFRPLLKPSKAGQAQLVYTLSSGGRVSIHDLGPVQVYASTEAAAKAAPPHEENPNRIAFSKEVQWKIPFLTAPAAETELASSIPVTVEVRFAPDGQAVLAAPVAGIVQTGANFPGIGARVQRGQVIGTISAQLGEGVDVATLNQDTNDARIAVSAAEREVARLRGLYRQEAVPLRRVQDAETELAMARSRLSSAQQRRNALAGGGPGVPLVAPISGQVLTSTLVRGASVGAGQEILRIGNPAQSWLVALVPQSLAAQARAPSGLEMMVDGKPVVMTAGKELSLISGGQFIDPITKVLEVIFAGTATGLSPGARLPARLLTGATQRALAVPFDAVINEGGQDVVYVQVEGEAFERRIVATGTRSGALVAITGDVKPGERVVTIGSAAVRAAAATPDAFGHGHAH